MEWMIEGQDRSSFGSVEFVIGFCCNGNGLDCRFWACPSAALRAGLRAP
jgi:hypothetical protein